jgi:hypothetical protein
MKRMLFPFDLQTKCTLITADSFRFLKEDCGIKILGQLSTIRHVIAFCRFQSQAYKDYQDRFASVKSFRQKRSASPDPLGSPTQSKRLKLNAELDVDDKMNVSTALGKTSPTDSSFHMNLDTVLEGPPNPAEDRLRTGILQGQDWETSNLTESLSFLPDQQDGQPTIDKYPPADGISKKPKRIAPTLITSNVDETRDREVPSAADTVLIHDPQNIEPGIVFRTEDGKKRLVPLSMTAGGMDDLVRRHQEQLHISEDLQKGGQKSLQAAKDLLRSIETGKAQDRDLSSGYLGNKKITVDEVFFGPPMAGGAVSGNNTSLDEAGSFDQVTTGGAISTGSRLYVYNRLKHFLNATPETVSRAGKNYSIVRPYPSQLAPEEKTPSLTVFRPGKHGEIIAARESLNKWPEVDPDVPKAKMPLRDADGNIVTFRSTLADQLGGPSSYDTFDFDSLEKYLHMEDDEVLPLYGDSDEDGEYDIDTWKEIEKEHGTLEKTTVTLKRQPIGQESISSAIEEGIALMVIKWNEEKLPKCQLKAWKLWKKCRRHPSLKRGKIREFQGKALYLVDNSQN